MRKLENGPALNLFSFQDVMASIIGILFVIVLLMVLLQSNETENTPNKIQKEIELLNNKINSLNIENQTVSEEIKYFEKHIQDVLHTNEKSLVEKSNLSVSELKVIYAKIENDNTIMSELLHKLENAKEKYRQKQKELKTVNTNLNNNSNNADTSARVSYILDKRSDLIPFLVELSDKNIRVALAENTSSVLEFTEGSYEDRKEMFMSWATKQSLNEYYYVFLIKPSALQNEKDESALRFLLKDKGFEIGFDLLPEKAEPF